MSLSTTIAQTQTDAASSPIITHLTSQCACKNNVISDRSEEVSGKTDWATSPGFIAWALRANIWQTAMRRTDRFEASSVKAPDGALAWIKWDRAASRLSVPPQTRHFASSPPSTIGKGQKVLRNLTKLGHRTGRSALASVIWVNAGLPAARTANGTAKTGSRRGNQARR